ncbi:MAG: ABC transporter ATP-binding protein, partial [Erysipelothrix sp.]|nr:ABC transporter ATP-binding protein [Erysipelothrix sp.]
LDDSTSALDQATEAQINQAFKEELNTTTIINIAQKISSIAHCDQIIVLDKGEVIGYGTHQSLLETNEVYQEIYESQMRKEVI